MNDGIGILAWFIRWTSSFPELIIDWIDIFFFNLNWIDKEKYSSDEGFINLEHNYKNEQVIDVFWNTFELYIFIIYHCYSYNQQFEWRFPTINQFNYSLVQHLSL